MVARKGVEGSRDGSSRISQRDAKKGSLEVKLQGAKDIAVKLESGKLTTYNRSS